MLQRIALLTVLCGALIPTASAQQQQGKASLDVSETLFSVITTINVCGYDQDLATSDPLRLRVLAEVNREIEKSYSAQQARKNVCDYYRDHRQSDQSRDLAQYVSLALNLGPPPAFTPTISEADLPPDAASILGIQHGLQNFYTGANLHDVWRRHAKEYDALIDANNEAIAKMLLATDVYLKVPVGGYGGRRLSILVEPMAGASRSNARNYGTEYYIVVSPEKGELKIDQIRHTYLHFILDPLAMKRGTTMQRLSPLLDLVKNAPMDSTYKKDITLLLTESIIKAVEARTEPGKGPDAEQKRQQKVTEATREGFILTPYFYEQLVQFEKDPRALQDTYGDWLHFIDLSREKHRASEIQFASTSTPDVVSTVKPVNLLDEAEKYFVKGDYARAKEIAQKALDSHSADPGRSYFVLARVELSSRNIDGAQALFQKAIESTHEPRFVAWSNIYLGRIFDLKSERDNALKHYRAALDSGDTSSVTKSAAERGLKQAYQPPASQKPQGTQEQ